jgi:hypothetical protein
VYANFKLGDQVPIRIRRCCFLIIDNRLNAMAMVTPKLPRLTANGLHALKLRLPSELETNREPHQCRQGRSPKDSRRHEVVLHSADQLLSTMGIRQCDRIVVYLTDARAQKLIASKNAITEPPVTIKALDPDKGHR